MSYTVQSTPIVNVFITSSAAKLTSEKRLQKDLSIYELKGKLQLISGVLAGTMELQLFTAENTFVCNLDDCDRLLGSYPIDDNMRIHVIDKSGNSLNFDDVSEIKKFELTDESYKKRSDSLLQFKKANKMGRFAENAEDMIDKDAEKLQRQKELCDGFKVGDRCKVEVKGQPEKRGVIMYIGLVEFKPGYWVGIQYDEPLGKHDGSVEGKRYFQCPPKYGAFVLPAQVIIGDFPELGIDDLNEL